MIRTTVPSALAKLLAASLTAALAFTLAPWLPGCGPGTPEFAKEAENTPESLAQEFAFRYKSLPAQSTARAQKKAALLAKAKAALPEVDAGKKSSRDDATKAAPVATLDDLVDEFEGKLGKVPGVPRAEATKKFLDALGKDAALKADDLQAVTGRLGKAS